MKPDMISAVDNLLQNNEYIVVMCLYFDVTLSREIIVYSRDEKKHKDMSLFLKDGKGSDILQFNEKESTSINGVFMSIYDQGNTRASRKQVAPFLLNFF